MSVEFPCVGVNRSERTTPSFKAFEESAYFANENRISAEERERLRRLIPA
jgi:hypothetical protein